MSFLEKHPPNLISYALVEKWYIYLSIYIVFHIGPGGSINREDINYPVPNATTRTSRPSEKQLHLNSSAPSVRPTTNYSPVQLSRSTEPKTPMRCPETMAEL